MSEYTPGPWIQKRSQSSNGRTYTRIITENNRLITDCAWNANTSANGFDANSNLIAAAPALLETLELCEKNIASLLAANHPKVYGAWLDCVRSAISKARGEDI